MYVSNLLKYVSYSQDSTLSYAIWGNPPTLNTVVTLYSETLLVTLPTPDFSMPYNVICLGQRAFYFKSYL